MTLIMTIMMSLCLALIEGVRYNAVCLESDIVLDVGMNSIFAEYHRELLEQYDLFAMDSSYGAESSGKIQVEQHLRKYVDRNFSKEGLILGEFLYKDFLALSADRVEVERVSILTDEDGAVFRNCAVESIKDETGLTLLSEIPDWVETVESNHLLEYDAAAQRDLINAELQKYKGKEKEVRPGVYQKLPFSDPTGELEKQRSMGALASVVPDMSSLSDKRIHQEVLVGNRMRSGYVNSGSIAYDAPDGTDQYINGLLFRLYLIKHMGHYLQEKENKALDYQLEYLICGKDSDAANLHDIAEYLVAMRWISNLGYLYMDAEKCAQAQLLALSLSIMIGSAEAEESFKSAILFSWAYGESLHDLELLLSNQRVPLIKTGKDWYYTLESVLTGYHFTGTQSTNDGLSYEDYLCIFMMFVNEKDLTYRAMNLVEADMRMTPGNQNFRLDACYVQVQATMAVKSAYGYLYEVTRRRKYR